MALTKNELIARAESLVPLLKETARESELARQPLDAVIEAVREAGLFSLMVPKKFGGHEADVDTFFEVCLTLAEGDASAAWIIGFYIEHNWWFLNYPEEFQRLVFQDADHVLAPAALSMGGGKARSVEGGYRLSGRWQWGTGVIHASWVIAGALLETEDGPPQPTFFALPKSDVATIDTWHMAGMSGTGSLDFAIDDVFVPMNRAVKFEDMIELKTGISERYDANIYRTPMLVILAMAAALPSLGTAKASVKEFCDQSKNKYDMITRKAHSQNSSRQTLAATATLEVECAEMMMRSVLADVMEKRNTASKEERAGWLARISHSVIKSRHAINMLCEAAGAGANHLDNPLQRALRDVNTASCHAVFDRDVRYRDFGRVLVGLEPTSALL